MARETTQRFLMLRSSFSLAWSSLGQLWKTRQPFSLKLLHSANQIEVLDKLLLSSVPAALRGEKQPITHKQVATTAIFALAWNESHRGSRWGWKGGGVGGWGGAGEAWIQTNQYAGALRLTLSAGFTPWPCKTVEILEIMLFPRVRAFPKLTTAIKEDLAFTELPGLRHCLKCF